MRKHLALGLFVIPALLLASCATVDKPATPVEVPVSQTAQRHAQQQRNQPNEKRLKRKVAIGRFTNETRYGKVLLGGDIDPLGRQTSDMLATRLVDSGKFIVLERPDLARIQAETGDGARNLVGVDTLILGSVTEFGRKVTGQKGFLSGTKKQTAHAKVEVRLVDVRTGHVFHPSSGSGEANLEEGEVAGFGSQASYDETLNDKAIGAAVSDLMNDLVTTLEERTWRTDILKVQGDTVYISGGARQGLSVGDELVVMRAGETVRSRQSGFDIQLPGTPVAHLTVESHFGETETNEGSVAHVVKGDLTGTEFANLYVTEP